MIKPICWGSTPNAQEQAENSCMDCAHERSCWSALKPGSALATQVGGDHYKDMPIQPISYIHRNGIGFIEGAVIKYVSRWKSKAGVEDLKKARHMLDLLIEMEG